MHAEMLDGRESPMDSRPFSSSVDGEVSDQQAPACPALLATEWHVCVKSPVTAPPKA
jgi:hypothetical protein